MKITNIFAFLLIVLFLSSCNEKPKESPVVNQLPKSPVSNTQQTDTSKKENTPKPKNPTGIPFAVASEESTFEWESKSGGKIYNGTVQWGRAELYVDSGKVTGANAIIDMRNIAILSPLETTVKEELLAKLQSESVLSVKTNPIARLYIFNVEPVSGGVEMTALVKIKNVEKQITFPAKVKFDKKISVSAEFTADKTMWGFGDPKSPDSDENKVKIKFFLTTK